MNKDVMLYLLREDFMDTAFWIDTENEVNEQISMLVNCIRQYRFEMDKLDQEIQSMKCQLTELLQQRGESWEDAQGYAQIVGETTRLDYNTAALNRLIEKDPLRYGWLKNFRMTTPVPSRLMVR